MEGLEPKPWVEGGIAESIDGGSGEFYKIVVECGWLGKLRGIGDYVGLVFMDGLI